MSSHYVFNRIGLFPKLGSALYDLHAPHPPRSAIKLPNGRTFAIVARGYRAGAIYIRRASLDGKRRKRAFVTQ